jgi:hypothetical protein
MHTKFCSGNLKGNHSENLGVDERRILGWILEKYGGKAWTGCTWLRIGINGGFL